MHFYISNGGGGLGKGAKPSSVWVPLTGPFSPNPTLCAGVLAGAIHPSRMSWNHLTRDKTPQFYIRMQDFFIFSKRVSRSLLLQTLCRRLSNQTIFKVKNASIGFNLCRCDKMFAGTISVLLQAITIRNRNYIVVRKIPVAGPVILLKLLAR